MEIQFGPNSFDEPNLLYKLQRKIKVFNTNDALPNRGYNLVTSSSKYGIVFIATPDGILSVYYLRELIDGECEPKHLDVKLQEKPTHIAVSCDQELLAVTGGQLLSVFSVTAFQNVNVSPALTIKCDVNTSTFVSALQWNPCIPDTIAVAFYDGTLLILQIATSQVKKVPSKARCICWSPKGKQLVTGNSDGTLSQYKPDLTLAKMIPAPNLFSGSPVEALAIYWISTFQFAVVYKNATDNSRPAVTIINAPKAGQPSCLNYEDICYSMCSNRPWYYYLLGLAQWNMILSSSSNSMEIATLGSADGASWVQWCQPDEARPELPLTDKKQENYPVGVCIDTCAIHQLPWGENSTLPHTPVLHVVSHSGLLTIFNVINLNNGAAQICSPPQQLTLPAAAMTSVIPDVVPAQPAPLPTSTPIAQPKPLSVQPAPAAPVPQSPHPPPATHFGAINTGTAKPVAFAPPATVQQAPQGFTAAASISSIKKPVVMVPISAPQLQTSVAQPAAPVVPKPQPPPQAQENAALKAEQERINEIKVNEELKNILVKEVNDFQMELYKFMTTTIETQKKLQHEIESFNAEFNLNSLNTEQLRKECCLDDLRNSIVHLKLELVRACAVVSEARTHAEAKDYNQWTQADPLTTKRVASVKKLAYYVQTQLDQAQKALDYRWSEVISSDTKYTKPGQHMIRPILDDVYQPLVKQQEILSRQQAVLRTLRSSLNDCDVTPMFKSSSLLRSTPFRNKDPLSKLTKNILNMSIDSSTKPKEPLLSAQKLDALRDMLSNHKTVKIKPVNVEMRQHLATMRQNYEKIMKDKGQPIVQEIVKIEPKLSQMKAALQTQNITSITVPKVQPKIEPKQEPLKQNLNVSSAINVPSFSPTSSITAVTGLTKVTRTLFTDEPKPDPPKLTIQHIQQQPTKPLQSAFCHPTTAAPTSSDTRSIVKELLQSKQTYAVAKSYGNTFMGQPICSPSSFAFSTPSSASSATTAAAAPSAVFTSKPIPEISSVFNKLQPQAFVQEPKPLPFVQEVKSQAFAPPKPSSETGEPEATKIKQITIKPKTTKPLTNLFAMKPSSLLSSSPLNSTSNVPDVLKSGQDLKTDKIVEPVEKELSKENIPDKVDNIKVTQKSADDNKEFKSANENKEFAKPIAIQATNKAGVFATTQPVVSSVSATVTVPIEVQNQAKVKTEAEFKTELPEKSDSPPFSAPSILTLANASVSTVPKPQAPDAQTVPTSPATSKPETPTVESSDAISKSPPFSTTPSAASIFGAAVASQPNITSQSQAGSIFAAAAGSSPPAFGGTQGSIFGTASTTGSSFGTSAAESVFSVETTKPSIFSTPTPSSPTSVFGDATTQSGSTFGSEVTPASTAFAPKITPQSSVESVFGSSTTSVFAVSSSIPSSPTTTPVFGSATSTTQPSVFGGAPTNLASAFTPTTTTTTKSIFGSTASSVFGNSAASVFGAANNQNSVFGAPSSQVSVFGTATPSTQASVFGSPTNQASIFGSAPSTQASVFGSAPASQASVFGSAPTTQAPVFGTTPTTTTQSGSLFGGTEMNLFASASISTTSAPSQSSGGSIFGSGSTGSVFGSSNANVFGAKSTFGQPNPSAAAIFGGGGASSFEQKPATNFWSGGNTNKETFGSSAFGQQATTQASSIFGDGSTGSFSSPSPAGQAFGNPQQTSAFGTMDNKTSVFGSAQQASAFGGSAVFGSKPVFGQPSGFGSPPSGGFGSGFGGFNKSPGGSFGAPATFGGSAAFGTGTAFGGSSPSKMFGSSTQSFGTTQSNATFENLATQNTLTFGNLAQQSGQQQQAAPAFNTSPSFTGWRG